MSGVCCCKTRAAREEELPTLSVYVLRVLISLLSSVRALWRRAGLQQSATQQSTLTTKTRSDGPNVEATRALSSMVSA